MSERPDISAGEAARILLARRRTVAGRCAVCGRPYSGSVLRRYCSAACRQKAVRQRRQQGGADQP